MNNSFDVDELAVIENSLDMFRKAKIEGVSKEQKKLNDTSIKSAKRKIRNRENDFTADEVRVILISVSIFLTEITETETTDIDLRNETKKYTSISNGIIRKLKREFLQVGININAV